MIKYQLGKVLLDLINRVNTELGYIDNLHGNVLELVEEAHTTQGAKWFYAFGEGTIPREIMIDAAVNDRSFAVVDSIAGYADFTLVGPPDFESDLLIYTGAMPSAVNVAGPSLIPIKIEAPEADIRLYINDTFVKSGTGELVTEVLLKPGKNLIQIALSKFSINTIRITVPADLIVGLLPDPPQIPSWDVPPIIYGFFGLQETSGANRLSWSDSGFAGAWNIERTSYRFLGTISSFSYDSATDNYSFLVEGDHTDARGDIIVDRDTFIGRITDATESGGVTTIKVFSQVGSGDWVDKDIFDSTAQAIIATIEREDAAIPFDGMFSFHDTAIVESMPYSYRISATHPLHPELESGWSERHSVFSMDETPPGSVTDVTVTVINGEIVIDYTAPEDLDYMGVRVFFELGGEDIAVINDFGRPGQKDQLRFFPPGEGDYWLRTFDWARNLQPEGTGYEFNYAGGAGTQFGVPADIIFRVLPTGAWDPKKRTDVEITAVPGPGRALTIYRYIIGTGTVWTDFGVNPAVLTFNRTDVDFSPRVLRVSATTNDDVEAHDVFVVDWDDNPGFSTYAVHQRFVGNIQVGWKIVGTTDDDARAVTATKLSGSGTILSPTTTDNTNIKDFVFNIDQSAGEKAEIRLTPYETYSGGVGTGVEGQPLTFLLQRNPISYHLTREISLTQLEITLTAIPSIATIKYRTYLSTATPQNFLTYSVPFTIIRNIAQDTILEFYAEYEGLQEEPINKVRVDKDTDAEVEILSIQEIAANDIQTSVEIDDDALYWKYYARPNTWPTAGGNQEEQPDDRYLFFKVQSSINEVTHYASTGTWYVMVRAYDNKDNPGVVDSMSVVVTGSAQTGGLTNPRVALVQSGSNYKHRVEWNHNALIETAYSGGTPVYDVRIYERNAQTDYLLLGTRLAALDSESGSSVFDHTGDTNTVANYGSFLSGAVFPGTAGDPNYSYTTYDYKVELLRDGVVIGTYFPFISGYYKATTVLDDFTATILQHGTACDVASQATARLEWSISFAPPGSTYEVYRTKWWHQPGEEKILYDSGPEMSHVIFVEMGSHEYQGVGFGGADMNAMFELVIYNSLGVEIASELAGPLVFLEQVECP